MTGKQFNFRRDFEAMAARTPDAVALVDARHDREYTYAEVVKLITKAEATLRTLGITAEKPVVSMLPNSIENFIIFLAALNGGMGFAPLPPQATPREFTTWSTLVSPGACIVSPFASDDLISGIEGLGVEIVNISLDGSFDWCSDGVDAAPSSDGGSRLYVASSGTTGEPKSMVMDGDRLWSSGRAFSGHHKFLDAKARYFNILPMSYLGGLFNLGLIPLASGGSTVITEPFSGSSFLSFWQDIRRFDINVLWLVPAIVRGLLTIAERTGPEKVAKSTEALDIRASFLGTAPIDLATKTRFEKVFGVPLLENYALSETTFLTSETLDTRFRRAEGSVGEVLPYVELVNDVENAKTNYAELRAKSPYMFVGYLREPGNIDEPFDDDGYLPTGDLGQFVDGTLLVGGRTRDIIKKGGYFIALRELEVLCEGHDDVAEAIAVPIKHDFFGEDLVIAIRLRDGTFGDDAADDVTAIRNWLHGNLVKYKWPARLVAVEDMPRTASGKVRKADLARELGVEFAGTVGAEDDE